MADMITIDGSFGEGGGQIVRTSLAMSLVTGVPFRIVHIRAGRKRPGLLRQHLTALKAAKKVSSARVTGDRIGASEFTFAPGSVRPGEYHFAVGTAGSATLVLQTVLPALILAEGASTLTLEGGTHNPFAPPWDFLDRSFLPILNRMGPTVTTTLDRYGFYPAGGGRFTTRIEPARELASLEITSRGEQTARCARALVANLSEHIAERELGALMSSFALNRDECSAETITSSPGPGNVLMVELHYERHAEVFTAFGQKGVRAEKVAETVAGQVRSYLRTDAPVGEYLADQLLVPMALAGEGRFRTARPSSHTMTNIEVLKTFLDINVKIEIDSNDVSEIVITRR